MTHETSTDLLADLLERVDNVRVVLESCVEEGEVERTLPGSAVTALEKCQFFQLKAPLEVGGFEALPSVQFAVLAAIAEINTAAAWCTMVANTGAAILGAYLDDEGLAEVFDGSSFPKAGGVAAPTGTATPVEGGHLVSGRWRFGSGIRHSDWLQVNAISDDEAGDVVSFAVRVADVTIEDTWHVIGLRGTGSADFTLDQHFVPSHLTFVRRPGDSTSRRRGGAVLSMPGLSSVTYDHAAIAYGLGRRAITLLQQATDAQTGHPGLASRGDVLDDIGRLSTRLAAAQTWVLTLHDSVLAEIESGAVPDPAATATMAQASACHLTEVAVEAVTLLFRLSGARALYVPSEIERLFRDINAVAEHVVVGNHVYAKQAGIPYADIERF